MDIAIVIALGLCAGVLSALFGVGGGLIFVPALIFLGENTHEAVATVAGRDGPGDRSRLVASVSVRRESVGADATIVGLAAIPTAKAGEVIANSLSNDALQRAFAVLLLLTAAQMTWRTLRGDDQRSTGEW